jgi:large subunit ribosomal protein L10
MEVGLNVVVFDERGNIYKAEDMFVDEAKLLNDIQSAIQNAFNLSINADFPTKETIGFMLAKAQMEAKSLEAEIEKGAQKEKPKEEKKEETKHEETPKEEVKEELKPDETKQEKATKEEVEKRKESEEKKEEKSD